MCAFPIAHAIETMRPRPVEPLRGMPAFVLGLAIIRGEPLPVVHLGRLLGAEGSSSASRFVTLRAGRRNLALAVEEVLGVREVDSDRLTELAPLLGADAVEVIETVGRLDAELLVVLSAMKIVPQAVWEALAAGPALVARGASPSGTS